MNIDIFTLEELFELQEKLARGEEPTQEEIEKFQRTFEYVAKICKEFIDAVGKAMMEAIQPCLEILYKE